MKSLFKTLSLAAAAVVGLAFGSSAENREKPKYGELYYQRASLFDELGVDSTSIVFFGNSLTHGCEWHELFDMPNIKNRGINGDIVEGLKDRLGAVTKGKPAKIFLLIGVNDISHNLTADSIATAIGELIADIRRETPTTRLYVESLLPFDSRVGRYKAINGKEDVVRQVNERLEPIVKAAGATWINVNPAFADADGYLRSDLTNDGLHLLGPGYLIWRDLLMPYVKE